MSVSAQRRVACSSIWWAPLGMSARRIPASHTSCSYVNLVISCCALPHLAFPDLTALRRLVLLRSVLPDFLGYLHFSACRVQHCLCGWFLRVTDSLYPNRYLALLLLTPCIPIVTLCLTPCIPIVTLLSCDCLLVFQSLPCSAVADSLYSNRYLALLLLTPCIPIVTLCLTPCIPIVTLLCCYCLLFGPTSR